MSSTNRNGERQDRLAVSVALCTHNGSRHIGVQVESILAQTLAVTEIVVSDDSSTDGTVELIEGALGRQERSVDSPRLHVLRNKMPLGVIKNFEQAIRSCAGDLVVLCDQDDRWNSERVERACALFEERPNLLLLHGDARLIDDLGGSTGRLLAEVQGLTAWERSTLNSEAALTVLLRRNVVTGATVMMRRSLFDIAAPFPTDWVHDEWLGVIAAALGGIGFYPEPLVDYRQHAQNQIGVQRRSLRRKLGMLLEEGTRRNKRQLSRAEVLVERIDALGDLVPDHNRELAMAKLRHESARVRMPANRALRVMPVLREFATGGYSQFARGRKDVLLDVMQPRRR